MLASVLAEYKLDNNAYGWFRAPWRDGINAANLARTAALRLKLIDHANTVTHQCNSLGAMTVHWRLSETYAKLGEWYQRLIADRENTDSARLLAAGARCVQLHIANSHGGGIAYNELLMPVFLGIEPLAVDDLVLEFRCVDAIGVSPRLRGDSFDRQRAAFSIAWKRGLYLAAYSIPPVSVS